VAVWSFRDFFSTRRLKKFASQKLPTLNLKQKGIRFLVTGGTGFIGSRLCKALIQEGHDVTLLIRDKTKALEIFKDIPGKLTLFESFDNIPNPSSMSFDVVINLAGEPLISRRWTSQQKERLFTSRIGTTNQLVTFLNILDKKPELLLSGSAIGIYGVAVGSPDLKITEDTDPVEIDSLTHKLCQEWETTALTAEKLGIRVVLLRTGLVLGREGGMMANLLVPFEFGLGGKMGSGQQYMPWVHIDDMLGIVAHIVNDNTIKGPVNATAPTPVTNAVFTKTLGAVMKRPTFMKLWPFQLKLIFGTELANEILLTGLQVVPERLMKEHYKFKYGQLRDAMEEIVRGEK